MRVNSGNFSEDFSKLSLEEKQKLFCQYLTHLFLDENLVITNCQMLQQRPITNLKNLKNHKMISPDIIKLSQEEFIALVEKYEAEAVKEYKEQAPETRDPYIIFWVPVNEKQCIKCFVDGLRNEYLENCWRQVDIAFVKDKTASLMIRLIA